MNYGALSAFREFSVSLAILLTRWASVVAETSQHSTETIPNLALFHGAIFTAVSTRPCTEATVTAGCRKLLCQELHNIAVIERNGFGLGSQYARSEKFYKKSLKLPTSLHISYCLGTASPLKQYSGEFFQTGIKASCQAPMFRMQQQRKWGIWGLVNMEITKLALKLVDNW